MRLFPTLILRDKQGFFFWTASTKRAGTLVAFVRCIRGLLAIEEALIQHCIDGERRTYAAASLVERIGHAPAGLRIESGI